jgi:hypothetical protein
MDLVHAVVGNSVFFFFFFENLAYGCPGIE